MGLIDVHLHEPDFDWNFNFGTNDEHHHDHGSDESAGAATEGDAESGGPNVLALVAASVVFALVATAVAVVAKKKLGGDDFEDLDELDVQ